jgi:hypothetical protein
LLGLILSQEIYLLIISENEKRHFFYQNGQKYFTNTLSLRKHQSTAMILFKLAMFLILQAPVLPLAQNNDPCAPPFWVWPP